VLCWRVAPLCGHCVPLQIRITGCHCAYFLTTPCFLYLNIMGSTKTHIYTIHQLEQAARLKALGHPARIAILEFILEHRYCIGASIVNSLQLAQPTVSRHLNELVDSGILEASSNGNTVRYAINEKHMSELLSYMVTIVKRL